MEKSIVSPLYTRLLSFGRNLTHVPAYLAEAYSDGKREIADGLLHFKEEFSHYKESRDKYTNLLLLPVNNFLKDFTQIDKEFLEELTKNEFCICLNGEMVPANEVLARPMEENY